jgi:hypothetical protein
VKALDAHSPQSCRSARTLVRKFTENFNPHIHIHIRHCGDCRKDGGELQPKPDPGKEHRRSSQYQKDDRHWYRRKPLQPIAERIGVVVDVGESVELKQHLDGGHGEDAETQFHVGLCWLRAHSVSPLATA